MAETVEKRPADGWGNWLGRRTFILTIIGAAMFVGAVFLFVL